ncbi:GTP-binding protein 2 [Apiospora aurea]|uniref:GTP-binding protein 2 n=1 Tax=Apiospora aurea TaxID=335848 RepID=A0ABR1QEW2_9PEZI
MASIFTFDPNPLGCGSSPSSHDESNQAGETAIDHLDAEPQEGPIEYKLHLLLRGRRKYEVMSTSIKASGSRSKPSQQPASNKSQTRQTRLQQLTTQLLWRLQQSAPYHAKNRGELIIPKLPEDHENLEVFKKPQRLLPGLEESNGALYEIGVADDGAFIGLTNDEMDESMTTLKIIAASLGCRVEVQRMKVVGNCEWIEQQLPDNESPEEEIRHHDDLWVAEALVMPILEPQKDLSDDGDQAHEQQGSSASPAKDASQTEQLRVSIIGPTTSGKTTLLGTLANGTLDNGRGSSRINLLKHRHERVSGQTSSVAQELIGYKDRDIFNYASVDIEAWTDIHDHSETGRMVFFSDSAGHLRFRRTIMRGLVGWAPHWTFLCITANGGSVSARGPHSLSGTTDDLGDMADSLNLALTHLDLCLLLETPMVIVVTKYDVAVKDALKSNLNQVFSKIKNAGRTPKLLMPKAASGSVLTEIPVPSRQQVLKEVVEPMSKATSLLSIVPVVLASAVKGQGIDLVHALLASLPMPPPPTARDYVPLALNPEQPAALFHIDDKYELESRVVQTSTRASDGKAIVVAGYLRFGRMSVGDRVVIGPFPAEDDEARGQIPRDHPTPGYGLSISHPSSSELARIASRNTVPASAVKGEWHNAKVVNIRNLRLPVRTMGPGQAGTIQIVLDDVDAPADCDSEVEQVRAFRGLIRKGQILAIPSQHMLDTGLSLQAASGFTAVFKDPRVAKLTGGGGTLVNVYVATVRTAARIVRVSSQLPDRASRADGEADDVFNMADSIELDPAHSSKDDFDNPTSSEYSVTLDLLSSREWIEMGSQVVLMEGGNSPGLEGYIGKVVEIAE